MGRPPRPRGPPAKRIPPIRTTPGHGPAAMPSPSRHIAYASRPPRSPGEGTAAKQDGVAAGSGRTSAGPAGRGSALAPRAHLGLDLLRRAGGLARVRPPAGRIALPPPGPLRRSQGKGIRTHAPGRLLNEARHLSKSGIDLARMFGVFPDLEQFMRALGWTHSGAGSGSCWPSPGAVRPASRACPHATPGSNRPHICRIPFMTVIMMARSERRPLPPQTSHSSPVSWRLASAENLWPPDCTLAPKLCFGPLDGCGAGTHRGAGNDVGRAVRRHRGGAQEAVGGGRNVPAPRRGLGGVLCGDRFGWPFGDVGDGNGHGN